MPSEFSQSFYPIFATELREVAKVLNSMNKLNLLLELGTEELPPKALRKLAESLRDNFVKHLNQEGLNFDEAKWYATPRRLGLIINALDLSLIHI